MKFLKLLLVLFVIQVQAQQGGMWIPSLLKGTNEKEMKALGMKISADDIYSVNNSSLKDAVPHFDGGCTAEMISPKGLLLTNHHCGYGNIQSHSTVENDLLTNGFWAKNMKEELPNPGVTVDFVVDIKEITQAILADTNNLSGAELNKKIAENTESYKKSQNIEFLAKEVEGDVLIFYTKIAISKKINTFEIFNSLLTEIYREQQNIIHTNINGNKDSFLLTNTGTNFAGIGRSTWLSIGWLYPY